MQEEYEIPDDYNQMYANDYEDPYSDSVGSIYYDETQYNWDGVEEEEFHEWSGGPHGRRLAEVDSREILQHYLTAPTHRSLLLKAKQENN